MNHWVEKYIRIIIRIKEAIRKGLFLISTIIAMHKGAKEIFCSLLHPSFLEDQKLKVWCDLRQSSWDIEAGELG